MPDNSTLTYLQTLNYVRDVIVDLVTNTTTYGTKYNFDANTSSVALDAPDNLKAQYASSLPAKAYMQTSSGNVYLDKDGYAYFSSIKLPKLPGYKAHLIKDPTNPAMFLVSFIALPQQNNQSNNVQSSQKEAQAEQKQSEPIQTRPADDKQVDQLVRTISYTLMHNDSSDTADDFDPAQNGSAPLEVSSDSTQKDDEAKIVNAAKPKKRIAKKHVVKRHKKYAKKYHLKRRSRKHTKHVKKRIIKHRKRASRKFRKYNLKHIKKS